MDVSKKRGVYVVDLEPRERLEEVRESGRGSESALDANFLALAVNLIKHFSLVVRDTFFSF